MFLPHILPLTKEHMGVDFPTIFTVKSELAALIRAWGYFDRSHVCSAGSSCASPSLAGTRLNMESMSGLTKTDPVAHDYSAKTFRPLKKHKHLDTSRGVSFVEGTIFGFKRNQKATIHFFGGPQKEHDTSRRRGRPGPLASRRAPGSCRIAGAPPNTRSAPLWRGSSWGRSRCC